MSEKNTYKSLKEHMLMPGDRIDRVENIVVTGMPDVNFCGNSIECWIEIKTPTEPKRKNTKLFGSNHKISMEQANWALRQIQAGGRVFFLIRTDKRWALVHGNEADYINDYTVADLILKSCWHSMDPTREKRWTQLRSILIT